MQLQQAEVASIRTRSDQHIFQLRVSHTYQEVASELIFNANKLPKAVKISCNDNSKDQLIKNHIEKSFTALPLDKETLFISVSSYSLLRQKKLFPTQISEATTKSSLVHHLKPELSLIAPATSCDGQAAAITLRNNFLKGSCARKKSLGRGEGFQVVRKRCTPFLRCVSLSSFAAVHCYLCARTFCSLRTVSQTLSHWPIIILIV